MQLYMLRGVEMVAVMQPYHWYQAVYLVLKHNKIKISQQTTCYKQFTDHIYYYIIKIS